MQETTASIYRTLVHKRFRSGPLPGSAQASVLLETIRRQVEKDEPVKLFQFWGGCKNPNLPSQRADICEELTLKNLYNLHLAVREVYGPGLSITLFPGDMRISCVNGVAIETARRYVEDLDERARSLSDIFSVVPVSSLYKSYAAEFEKALSDAEKCIGEEVLLHPGFETLRRNSQKNILRAPGCSDEAFMDRCTRAARGYIVYRIAEEQARIYREYSEHIRCSFIRFSPFFAFYRQYIFQIEELRPRLDSVLHFYTGSKGNITQPWQAMGTMLIDEGKRMVFISGKRMQGPSASR
jgi:hypothetical protein